MRDHTLLLVHNFNSPCSEYMRKKGYYFDQVFKDQNLFNRFLRKVDMRINSSQFNPLWLSEWRESIHKYETIIIFANSLYRKVIGWIRKQVSNARIIVWYWDPYSSCKLEISDIPEIEEWSFDIEDCRKRGFRYNNTFYCYMEDNTVFEENIYDVLFVGLDKGRYDYLKKLEKVLVDKNLRCEIRIVKDRWTYLKPRENIKCIKRQYKPAIPYWELLQYIKQSKALLDINQEKQSGLSQRPLEALFYNKKLITNNPYIREMDFYDKNNIYIIEDNKLNGIEEFMDAPFHEIPSSIKAKYTFENWISQFYKN